jgi:hypothetical protein
MLFYHSVLLALTYGILKLLTQLFLNVELWSDFVRSSQQILGLQTVHEFQLGTQCYGS